MTLLHTILRVPAERGNGRTFGRLTIADATNGAGCPVIDSGVMYLRDNKGAVLRQVRGVVVSPRPTGHPAVAIAWQGSPDVHRHLMRLRRVPGLRRLVTSRGHLV